jgi:hypothetical protein
VPLVIDTGAHGRRSFGRWPIRRLKAAEPRTGTPQGALMLPIMWQESQLIVSLFEFHQQDPAMVAWPPRIITSPVPRWMVP